MIWFGEPFCSFDMTCMPWHVGVSRIWWMNNVLDNMVETALHGTGWGRGGVLWSSQVLAHTRLLFLSKDDFCACVRQHACPLSWRIFFVCDLSSKPKHAKQSRESGGLGLFFGGGWPEQTDEWRMKGWGKTKRNQIRSGLERLLHEGGLGSTANYAWHYWISCSACYILLKGVRGRTP